MPDQVTKELIGCISFRKHYDQDHNISLFEVKENWYHSKTYLPNNDEDLLNIYSIVKMKPKWIRILLLSNGAEWRTK